MKKFTMLQILSLLMFVAFLPSQPSLAKNSFHPAVKFAWQDLKTAWNARDHRDHDGDKDDRKSCHRGPASNPIPPGYCSQAFEKKVPAYQFKESSLIYFDIKDLEFLNSPLFVLKDVELEVTFKGKFTPVQTVNISLNGFKVSHEGGNKKLFKLLDYIRGRDESRGSFKLHSLTLNGSEHFDHFLARLKRDKGLLRISVLGRHPKILSATITFRGTSYFPCSIPPTTTTTVPGSTTTTTTLPGSTTTTTVPAPTTTTTTSTTTTTTLPPEDLSLYQAQIDSVNPVSNPTGSTSMVIYFSTVNTDGSDYCSLDQAAFEKCQSPVSLAGLGNGDHTFQVYAQTPRGVSTSPASYTWTVDSVPPVVTITNLSSLPSLTNQTSITFQFASNKSGTFKCSLDGGAPAACTSPVTDTVVNEGLHNFSVTAIDSVGNVSGSPAQYSWTIDLTPPAVSITSVNPNEEISGANTKDFVFAASETSNFECSLDQAGFSGCQSPLSLSNLSEGNHVMEIRATDLAGNLGSVVSYSWLTDYTAPQLTLGAVQPAQGLTNATQISTEFFSNETGKTFCSLDSQSFAECSSPFTSPVTDGAHQLVIYAVDQVGHQSASATLTWTVDATAPVISFGDILPSAETYLNSGNVSFAINASENVTLSASLNGAAVDPMSNPLNLQGLSEGSYTLQVSAYDAAGNFSNSINHSFVVDLTAPVINLNSDGGSLTNLDSRSFTFSSNETSTFECNLDEAGFAPCQSPMNYSGLADGNHTMIVRATDLAGNSSQSSLSWTVDATAPTTLQSHNQIGNAITFSLSSNEANVTYTCSLDGSGFTACSSPVSYSGLSVGTHTFVAKATDAAGNTDPTGASYTFNVLPPIQTSITSSSPSASLVNVKTMTIYFTANQTASGYRCSLDGAALASCSSPVSYSGLADGNHTFVVKAIDAYGTMDTNGASKSWTVDTTPPTITSFTTSTTTSSITVTWYTSEPTTGKVTYGVGTSLNQSTAETTTYVSPQTVKLTGLSSNTTYSIQVSGRDAAGNTYTSIIYTARTNR